MASNSTEQVLDLALYTTRASVLLAVVAFISGLVIERLKKKGDSGLEVHLVRAAAAGAIPTSILLVYGGFDPSVISKLSGLNVPISAAGLALLYISIKAVFKSN